jgi:hypothetical protein
MILIVRLARSLSNRSAPAALLLLSRRPAFSLSAAALVRLFVKEGKLLKLLSGAARQSLALLADLRPLNPPAQKKQARHSALLKAH